MAQGLNCCLKLNAQSKSSDAEVTFHQKPKTQKHLLTNQHIYVNFYKIEIIKRTINLDDNFLKIKASDINGFPMSRLIYKYLERCELVQK